MAKSKIIKEIANGEIELNQALRRLLVITIDLENNKLNEWIKKELNGYKTEEEVPKYRKNIGTTLKYTGFNSRTQVTNVPLPINYISKDNREFVTKYDAKEGISLIQKYAVSNEVLGKDCTLLAHDVANNTGNQVNCVSITMQLNNNSFHEIIENVTTNLLEILMELEKEFGILDDLDINIEEKDDIKKINKNIDDIMYENGLGSMF